MTQQQSANFKKHSQVWGNPACTLPISHHRV